MFLYTRYPQIIYVNCDAWKLYFPPFCFLMIVNWGRKIMFRFSPRPSRCSYFSFPYTNSSLGTPFRDCFWSFEGILRSYFFPTVFLFVPFFRICGFDDPTCFPVDEAFSCYRFSCLWFQSGVHKPRSPGWLHFVRWHLMFVGPHYGTCCMWLLRRPELWVGFCIFGKCVHPCF